MRFRLVTAVWGSQYTKLFLELTLRSLMAKGNLPELASRYHVLYSIYTTKADLELFNNSEIFNRAKAFVKFDFNVISAPEINLSDPYSHWILWRHCAKIAQKENEYFITVAADHIFSSDTLMLWADIFSKGSLAIFTPGIQVVRETISSELKKSFPEISSPIELSLEELQRLMLKHFHPVKISMLRDSPR